MKLINYGCGLNICRGWENYDASPTLYLQRMPLVGLLAHRCLSPNFPEEIKYGNIVYGLPVELNSINYVYCSHVLEHLSLVEFRKAIKNTLLIMKQGAVFRGVLPDLEYEVRKYLADNNKNSSIEFMKRNDLGEIERIKTLIGLFRSYFGNSKHLWMWDYESLEAELLSAGFRDVRRACFGDSEYAEYQDLELKERWENCLGFEAVKP